MTFSYAEIFSDMERFIPELLYGRENDLKKLVDLVSKQDPISSFLFLGNIRPPF